MDECMYELNIEVPLKAVKMMNVPDRKNAIVRDFSSILFKISFFPVRVEYMHGYYTENRVRQMNGPKGIVAIIGNVWVSGRRNETIAFNICIVVEIAATLYDRAAKRGTSGPVSTRKLYRLANCMSSFLGVFYNSDFRSL